MRQGPLVNQAVLIADDELAVARALQEGLQNAGADVTRAPLSEVLSHIRQQKPSAVILDCNPISRERRAFIRELRHHRVPYLFYSTEPPRDVTTERDAPFIAKPCPPEKIVAAIRYLVGSQ